MSKYGYLKALRGHNNISNGAYRVLVGVWNYTDESGKNAHPGESRLAHDTGMSQRSVRDHLKWLTETGYLTKVKRGHGSAGHGFATTYELGQIPEKMSDATGENAGDTGEFQQDTGENALDTGKDSPTIRSYTSYQLPSDQLPSDPLTLPNIDPQAMKDAAILKLLEFEKSKRSPTPCQI